MTDARGIRTLQMCGEIEKSVSIYTVFVNVCYSWEAWPLNKFELGLKLSSHLIF